MKRFHVPERSIEAKFPMMHRGKDPAETFKNMEEELIIMKLTPETTKTTSTLVSGNNETEKNINTAEEPNVTRKVSTLLNVSNDCNSKRLSEEVERQAVNTSLNANNTTESKDVSSEHRSTASENCANGAENKENTVMSSSSCTPEKTQEEDTSSQRSFQDSNLTASKQHNNAENNDFEATTRRAQEEGRVNVVFPGAVTQEGCCRFVSEILKCVLYQRQQLPMTYDQLVYSQKKRQASTQDKDVVSRRPVQSADKCQQTLQELEEVLQQLEVLFSLSIVPRVLLLMGGSVVLPKELYEINMEALLVAGGDQCLRVSPCLRQLFRTLFVADILSDTRPVRLMPTTVLALAHRDCGVGWFRPKLQFKVPTRVNNNIIALSTDPSIRTQTQKAEGAEWVDYVWFQAPVNIKGFRN